MHNLWLVEANVKWLEAILVRMLRVCSFFQEHADTIHPPAACGHVQWGLAIVINVMHVGT